MRNYIEPHLYDWSISDNEIFFSYPKSKPIIAYGEINRTYRLMKHRNGQIHFYYGYNSIKDVNRKYGTHFQWGELYHELFKPTPYLQNHINSLLNEIGKYYIVFHTRFLNLLGDKNETAINPEASQEQKNILQKAAVNKIINMSKDFNQNREHKCRIMLASDSMTFINYAIENIPDVFIVPGIAKHIDTANETNDSENLKVFADYYLIASAQKVFSLVGKGMWESAFPQYAALIGNTPFERFYF